MAEMLDSILKSMNCIGILITDGKGNIIHVDSNFNEHYGIPSEEMINNNVIDLEKKGIFSPSSVAMALKAKEEVTIIQKLKNNQEVIVTAVPLVDETGEIFKVVTFSRDLSAYTKFQHLYEELNNQIENYNRSLEELSYEHAIIEDFQTSNGKFRQILMSIQRVAKYDVNILLQGETGTGKTLLAKKIHKLSNYSKGRFVEINCGAMPDNLIESELFGYEKGAFTGASSQGKQGLFEIANDGTLFLDEISEMPISSQVKLLKVLQDQSVRRVGGTEDISINCRIISASNKDLFSEAETGSFRMDLLYRINMVSFTIPPLRERREDIANLTDSILLKANQKYEMNKKFDSTVMNLFMTYPWPGNTRELENTIYRAAITCEHDIITKEYLPLPIQESSCFHTTNAYYADTNIIDLKEAMELYEGEIIRKAYSKAPSSISLAKLLNISQATAARKIRKYITQ